MLFIFENLLLEQGTAEHGFGKAISGQRPFFDLLALDDRFLWVAWRFEFFLPRGVDGICGQVRQLGHPLADVIPVWVEFLALQNRVEDAEVRCGVGAGSGCPLPAAVVGGRVAVEQVVHEPAFAPLPVDQQILDQEGGHDHARPIVHPAGFAQLAHGGIHDRHAGATIFPGLKIVRIVAPGDVLQGRVEGLTADAWEMIQDRNIEFAPDEFIQPRFRAFFVER